jgi:hypothetical protein
MKTTLTSPLCYEFGFPQLDTSVLVEVAGDDVVVRASRDSFSPTRRAAFVHELAAEGFIPEEHLWFDSTAPGGFHGVRWLVDPTWLEVPVAATRIARRFMLRLFAGTGLLWVALMAAVVLRG